MGAGERRGDLPLASFSVPALPTASGIPSGLPSLNEGCGSGLRLPAAGGRAEQRQPWPRAPCCQPAAVPLAQRLHLAAPGPAPGGLAGVSDDIRISCGVSGDIHLSSAMAQSVTSAVLRVDRA